MTEVEWLAGDNAFSRLHHVRPDKRTPYTRDEALERKGRLFLCAGCRWGWNWLVDERSRRAVEIAERYADGDAAPAELRAANAQAKAAIPAREWDKDRRYTAQEITPWLAWSATEESPWATAAGWSHWATEGRQRTTQYADLCAWLRDMFGNPFRPLPALDVSWLSWNEGILRKLAQAIYDERAFEQLPILADALEEAGCTDEQVLSHCRQPGEHVRGCWVVDRILGA